MGEAGCGSSTPPHNLKNATTAPRPGSGGGGGGGGGATKYLSNLPSRGLLSSSVLSSNLGGLRVYICQRDTLPPENQLIKTDQVNILTRSLLLKKEKAESGSKDGKSVATSESSRKRTAEKAPDGKTSAKKAASSSQAASRLEGTKNRTPNQEFQSMTVERLRSLLKEKGLSPRGKKDELIARLKESHE